jgi:hypothetical protein
MEFGKRMGPESERWAKKPVREDSAEIAEYRDALDSQLLDAVATRYPLVRVRIEQAVAEMDAATSDGHVSDIQRTIDEETNTDQGSKLDPGRIRRYLELKREKGRGR